MDFMKLQRSPLLAAIVVSTAMSTLGCSPESIGERPVSLKDGESTAKRAFAFKSTTKMVGDWTELPDFRQCYVGMSDFYRAKFGVQIPYAPETWNGACAPWGACHLWLDAIPDPNVWERHEAGSGEPTTYDMIVYPPTDGNEYGHVAGVDHVENGLIYVMDTNFSNNERRSETPHTVGWGEYGWYHLRAEPLNPGQVGACAGLDSGLYCGGNKVTGDPNTLYRCINGNLSVVNVCSGGCKPMPEGSDDQCFTEAGGGNPASACAGVGDGLYCGGDTIVGDAATLYQCSGGNISVVSECQYGCKVNLPGTNDECKSQNSSSSCAGAASGYYCGGNGVSGDPNTLYHCSNGTLSVTKVCQYGCQPMAAGQDDVCKTSGGGGGGCAGAANGLYCGGNGVSGDPGTLYLCSNGTLSVSKVCQYGCQPMAAGQDDACKTSGGGGGGCAGAANGLYCGGNGVTGDPGTLYLCSNGNLSVSQVCQYGCQPMAAGLDDACKSSGGSLSCAGSSNGYYCGGNGVPGNTNTLYLCSNGTMSVVQVCPNGCSPQPPGFDDKCK